MDLALHSTENTEMDIKNILEDFDLKQLKEI